MQGFIPDIYRILGKYSLLESLNRFETDGIFMSKLSWKRAVRANIYIYFFLFLCPLLLPLRTLYFFTYRVRIYKYKPFIYRKLVYMFVRATMELSREREWRIKIENSASVNSIMKK